MNDNFQTPLAPGPRGGRPLLFLGVYLSVLATPSLSLAGASATVPVRLPAMTTPMPNDLMPVPAEVRFTDARLPVTNGFTVAVTRHDDARLRAAIARWQQRWTARAGIDFRAPTAATVAAPVALVIECQGPGSAVPSLDEDESYSLDVTAGQATLRAATVVGAMRGLETLGQLLMQDAKGWFLPAISIRDHPRFPWRGLLIDVARHWQPVEVIQRNLDGMALVKLNVLHLHLTDDQGFRIESRTHPELQAQGSDGLYFTQDQMRDLIAYAQARGIRVVPEFDLPGHATSWVVSHPELASLVGPYAIERHWGIFNAVLDPTNEALYPLLDDLLGEMAALFPDPFLHVGGDENNGVQWSANPRIQAFIIEHGLKDNAGLQTYFNRRVSAILARHGKQMIGWDEILQPDLPQEAVIQTYRGPAALATAARQGYRGLLSHGYYIDLMRPAAEHYLNDPLPATTSLAPEEQRRILGGEATMWSEWVTPESIDARIWPRTAAIAERLWSPREVRDVADLYRRLPAINARLEEAGLLQNKNRERMLRRLAGDQAAPAALQALRTLADVVEPVKDYRRGGFQPGVAQSTPLVGLVDCAGPDSAPARNFARMVDQFLFQSREPDRVLADQLLRQLETWNAAGRSVAADRAAAAPGLKEGVPVARALAEVSGVGRDAVQVLLTAGTPDEAWVKTCSAVLLRADDPGPAAVELPILPPLKLLVAAAAEQHQRKAFSSEAWEQYVRAIALPTQSSAP